MKLKINNVRISLLQEMPLKEAVSHKLGVRQDDIKSLQIMRKAVDARRKNNVCLNFHVLADVDGSKKQLSRLLKDKDISQYKEEAEPELILGELPLAAPPVVIGAGPAGLLAALELAKYGYRPLLCLLYTSPSPRDRSVSWARRCV